MKAHRYSTILTAAFALNVGALLVQAADGAPEHWEAPARSAKKKNPVASSEASLIRGREVYIKECASCHGDQGRGDGPGVKDLEVKPGDLKDPQVTGQSDGALFWKITEGRKPMPSFAENYSDDDRWNLVNYLRKLTGKTTTQP